MANKKTQLSIVVAAVDKTTAVFRAVNARISAMGAHLKAIGVQSGVVGLFKRAGDAIVGVFKTVGGVIGDVIKQIPVLGAAITGMAAGAVFGLMKLVDHYDELGDKAEELGVGVDFLAQMRFAAEKSGASIESLDSGLKGFVTSLGQARAGTGRMAAFLKTVSPALYRQVRAAKSNEQAFDLMANAMAKLTDPAKRAALAQKTFGDAALAPLLARGAVGVKQLRDEYFKLAGPQAEAAKKAGEVDDAMKRFKASTDGIKASLVTAFGPLLTKLLEKAATFISENRERIGQWITDIAEKIPGAIQTAITWLEKAFEKVKELWGQISRIVDKVEGFIDKLGGVQKLWDLGTAGSSKIRDVVTNPSKWGVTSMIGNAAPGSFNALNLLPTAQAPSVSPMAALQASPTLRAAQQQLAARPNIAPQARAAIGPAQQQQAKISIDLNNAPRGTRVKTDPKSTAAVDLSVGYQMLGIFP